MSKMLVFLALAVALVATASAAPVASERHGQSVRPADGSYQVADRWSDRICCKRGWQDWWTTRRACERAGGHQTRNKECREDWNDKWDWRWWGWSGGDWSRRVCCKRGKYDWWTTARECRNAFGYETANWECRDEAGGWDRRVCCKRGWQDWWTTWRACQRAGGHQVRNKECRDDWNDKWDWRWWNWEGGDWNRRVCCKRGNVDWWTTARECRNAYGYVTSNRECRNDPWPGNNGNWNDGPGNWQPNYNDGWVDPYGRPDRRVCCKKGYSDWWTSARECHYAGGYETANKACRRD